MKNKKPEVGQQDIMGLLALLSGFEQGCHKHKCPKCLVVWEHDAQSVQASDTIFDEAHRCPQCKGKVVLKHRGPGAPAHTLPVCERSKLAA